MTVQQETVAQRYLARLREHGITRLFGNAGTDFPPLIEALARGGAGIEPVLVPHENVAIAMAYGAALASGKPQLVMAHVGLGTANAICGLFNAARQHVPIILSAGRTPVLEAGRLGARNNYINWAQEMTDQGGMVRELVKWDYELRDPQQVDAFVDRALAVAQSEPQGPVYLVLPREVLAAPALRGPDGGLGRQRPSRAGLPPQADLQTAAEWLAKAKRPLLVTADTGRTVAGFDALKRLAEERRIPVVQYRPRYLSLPSSSPAHAGYDASRLLPDCDLVLVADADVPWVPGHGAPPASARVIQLGMDPLCLDYPMRGFRSDLTLQGDSAAILDALRGLCQEPPASEGWMRQARAAWDAVLAQPVKESLGNRFVSREIAKQLGDDGVLFNEYTFALEEVALDAPGRYFSHSPAGGLGWAMGAAMGFKLERPDAVPVCAIGDGTYMFGNPTPTHFVSRAQGLPFLAVVFNNRRWAAVHRATLSMYGDGAAAQVEQPVFATLEPAPDYEKLVEASGGLGIRVERPEQLAPALERAMQAVRREKRQAVLNVLVDVAYERTS